MVEEKIMENHWIADKRDFRKGAGISEKGNLTPRDKMKRNSKEF